MYTSYSVCHVCHGNKPQKKCASQHTSVQLRLERMRLQAADTPPWPRPLRVLTLPPITTESDGVNGHSTDCDMDTSPTSTDLRWHENTELVTHEHSWWHKNSQISWHRNRVLIMQTSTVPAERNVIIKIAVIKPIHYVYTHRHGALKKVKISCLLIAAYMDIQQCFVRQCHKQNLWISLLLKFSFFAFCLQPFKFFQDFFRTF